MRTTFVSTALVMAALSLVSVSVHAQGDFVLNPSYLWPLHNVVLGGSDWDNIDVGIQRHSDYRLFRLKATTGQWFEGSQILQVSADMDNNGTFDLVVDYPAEATIPWYYPEPVSWFDTHEIRLEVDFINSHGLGNTRSRIIPVTIARTPRVFTNDNGDALVQVMNHDCSGRIPLLVVESIDWGNQTFPESYTINYATFIQSLYDRNFEVFVLNFAEGGGDIPSNANVFSAALAKVHELCPAYDVAVLGFSMGAVVARYALAQQESQNLDHHVGLFMAFDSPLEGAWINPQLTGELAQTITTNEVVVGLQAALQSPAAKQLLLTNPYDVDAAAFLAFHAEMDALGYPERSYNVAVSNGNMQRAHGQGWLDQGMPLLTLTILKDGQGGPVFTILSQPYDRGVGSLSWEIPTPLVVRGDLFNLPFVGDIDYQVVGSYVPVFVPTWSALGMKLEDVEFSAWGDMVEPIPPSPFDEYLVQDVTKRKHLEMTALDEQQLLTWLTMSFDVVVNYQLVEGGTVAAETFPLPVLQDGSVTIQPKTVVVGGRQVTYQFAAWDDGSVENPRTFRPTHDVTRTVIMKAHLASTSSGETWNSTQRRIVEVADAYGGTTQHAVYESGGSVWYLRNRWNAGWETERLISEYGVGATDPTIVAHWTGYEEQIQVSIAWTEPGINMYRESNWDNGATWGGPTWGGVIPIAFGQPDACVMTFPDYRSLMWAVADDEFGDGAFFLKWPRDTPPRGAAPEDASWWWPSIVAGTEGNTTQAVSCVANECGHSGGEYQIAFIRDGKIYETAAWDPDDDEPVPLEVCRPATDLTTSGWSAVNPSIVSTTAGFVVAWEEWIGGVRRIAFRERSAGVWSPTTYFDHAGHIPRKPAVGFDNACGQVNLVWECSGHVARVSRAVSGAEWSAVEDLGTGRGPSIVASGIAGEAGIWTSGGSSPYAINVVEEIPCADVSAPAAVVDLMSALGRTTGVVNWTAPGDDGAVGQASEYDLRWSLSPITEATFAAAIQIATPAPGPAGTGECIDVMVQAPCAWHYYALKTRDEVGNWSAMSDVASARSACSGWIEFECSGGMFAEGGGSSGWEAENELLASVGGDVGATTGTEELAGGSGGWTATDFYRMKTRLVTTGGRYAIQLVNRGGETLNLDQASLVALDHGAETKAWVREDGILMGTSAPAFQVTNGAGQNVAGQLDDGFVAVAGDVLDIQFMETGEGVDAMVIEAANSFVSSDPAAIGILLQKPASGGGWETVAHHVPRVNFDEFVVDPLGSATARLVFLGTHRLRSVSGINRGGSDTPTSLGLLEATHSRLESVRAALSSSGSGSATIEPGDVVTLWFEAPEVAADKVRDWFLGMTATGTSGGAEGSLTSLAVVGVPTQFALAQNLPNPFTWTTSIHFDVPRPAWIRLDVFDIQGRLVRQLANKLYEPGSWSVDWDRRLGDGRVASPGVYLYRMAGGDFRAERKLIALP